MPSPYTTDADVHADGYVQLKDLAGAPANPAAGYRRLYALSTGCWSKDSAGTVVQVDAAAGGGPTVVTKAANQVFSVTALADVTDLSFSLAANTDYRFEFLIWFDTTVATNGINLSVNGPAGPTKVGFLTVDNGTASTPDAMQAAAYDGGATFARAKALTDNFAIMVGVIRNGGTAGTFILRAASEGAGNPPSVTIKAGSKGILTVL